jgi:predicted alpha/beta hydrolase
MATFHKEQIPLEMGDGTRSEITLLKTKSNNLSPVLICFPAMGVSAKFYYPLALRLAQRGWNVVTADLRGNGHSSVRASKQNNFGYHEMLTYDWPVIVSHARSLFPNHPLLLLGHSLGGQLSALYSSIQLNEINGLILIAACSVFYKGWDFPRNLGVLTGTQLARAIANIMGYFPGERIGFAGIESRQVIGDWASNARTGRYDIANSPHCFEELLDKVTIPVLAISFEDDGLAPKRAVQNLCQKIGRAQLTQVELGSNDGEKNIDHFNWLRRPEPVVAEIEDWFNSITSA